MNLKQRIAKIHTNDDLEKQIELSRESVKRLRNEAKKAGTLAEKLALNERLKEAERVNRELRRLSFDIEDALAANQSPLSLVA